MFVEAINNLITLIGTIPDFDEASVKRGEPGIVSTVKNNACLIIPDFDYPENFSKGEEEYSKLVPYICTCFVIAGNNTTLEASENEALNLVEKVVARVTEGEQEIDMNGNKKMFRWELNKIDFYDRSASICSVAVDFRVKLQI